MFSIVCVPPFESIRVLFKIFCFVLFFFFSQKKGRFVNSDSAREKKKTVENCTTVATQTEATTVLQQFIKKNGFFAEVNRAHSALSALSMKVTT